jgi:hypothetical protein
LLVAFDKHNSQLDRHRLLKFPPIPPYTTFDFSSLYSGQLVTL